MKKIIWYIIHVLNLFIVLSTFVLLFIAIFKKEYFDIFIEWMRAQVNYLWDWNYLIILLTAFIESFPLLWMAVPWQTVMLVVWWFHWADNLFPVIIVAVLWALLWNYVWYLLWVYYWEDFFKKYWDWLWIWMTELKYMKKWIKTHWRWMIVIWKFHNMLRAFIPFIAWSMWMKKSSFVLFNVIWSILRAISIIVLWVFFVENYEVILDNLSKILLIIFVIFAWYIYFFKKKEFLTYLKEKEKEIEEKYNKKQH